MSKDDSPDFKQMAPANQTEESSSQEFSGNSNESPENSNELRQHRFECRSCSYTYDPIEGVKKFDIASGTAFLDLDKAVFKCPVCRMGVDAFKDIGPRSSPSGFDENLNYGFGINNLTPGQKNVLIFGGLAFAVACFLSLYSLH